METKPSTLIILSPGFPKDEYDSTCLPSQQNFVKALNRVFPELEVIILSFQYPFTIEPYQWNGNKVLPFNGRNKGNVFRLLLWRRVLKELKILHRENNLVGILSFWCGETALIGNRFAKKYGLKHICWIRGQDAKKENKYVKRNKLPVKELIALSDFLSEEYFTNHKVKPITVIPNGIDTSAFPVKNLPREIDILGVGSLIPLKQFDVFIKQVKEIKKHFPEIKAAICGSGPEEEALRKKLNEYALENNISLVGELAHADILKMMQRSRILLHTSRYEGFPAVCLEALYAGCQVISFVKSMNQDIKHWHIAKTHEEMLQRSLTIIKNTKRNHSPVLPYRVEDSAIAIMNKFGYKAFNIS